LGRGGPRNEPTPDRSGMGESLTKKRKLRGHQNPTRKRVWKKDFRTSESPTGGRLREKRGEEKNSQSKPKNGENGYRCNGEISNLPCIKLGLGTSQGGGKLCDPGPAGTSTFSDDKGNDHIKRGGGEKKTSAGPDWKGKGEGRQAMAPKLRVRSAQTQKKNRGWGGKNVEGQRRKFDLSKARLPRKYRIQTKKNKKKRGEERKGENIGLPANKDGGSRGKAGEKKKTKKNPKKSRGQQGLHDLTKYARAKGNARKERKFTGKARATTVGHEKGHQRRPRGKEKKSGG